MNATKQGLKEKDLLALEIAGKILNTRIAKRLRQKGLAYHHNAMFFPRRGASGEDVEGIISVSASTAPDQVNRVVEIIRDELKTLKQLGVSVDEVGGAKNALVSFENYMGPLAHAVSSFSEGYTHGAAREESLLQWMQRNTTMRERLTAQDVNTTLSGLLTEMAGLTVVAGNL